MTRAQSPYLCSWALMLIINEPVQLKARSTASAPSSLLCAEEQTTSVSLITSYRFHLRQHRNCAGLHLKLVTSEKQKPFCVTVLPFSYMKYYRQPLTGLKEKGCVGLRPWWGGITFLFWVNIFMSIVGRDDKKLHTKMHFCVRNWQSDLFSH